MATPQKQKDKSKSTKTTTKKGEAPRPLEFRTYDFTVVASVIDNVKSRCVIELKDTHNKTTFMHLPQSTELQNECLQMAFEKSIGDRILIIGKQHSRRGNKITLGQLEHVVATKPIMTKIDAYIEKKADEAIAEDNVKEPASTGPAVMLNDADPGGPTKLTVDASQPGQEGMVRRILAVHKAIHSTSVEEVVLKNGDREKAFPIKRMGKDESGNYKGHLRTVQLQAGDKGYLFLQQNPDAHKVSAQASAARAGSKVTWVIRKPDEFWMGHVIDGNWIWNRGAEERIRMENEALKRVKETEDVLEERASAPSKSAAQLELEQIHSRVSGTPSWEYDFNDMDD